MAAPQRRSDQAPSDASSWQRRDSAPQPAASAAAGANGPSSTPKTPGRARKGACPCHGQSFMREVEGLLAALQYFDSLRSQPSNIAYQYPIPHELHSPHPLQWNLVSSLHHSFVRQCGLFSERIQTRGWHNPDFENLARSFRTAESIWRRGLLVVRLILRDEEWRPSSLEDVFAFVVVSYVASEHLIKNGDMRTDFLFVGLNTWLQAIASSNERIAFETLVGKMWPEARKQLHAQTESRPMGPPARPASTSVNVRGSKKAAASARDQSPTTATFSPALTSESASPIARRQTFPLVNGPHQTSPEQHRNSDRPPTASEDVSASPSLGPNTAGVKSLRSTTMFAAVQYILRRVQELSVDLSGCKSRAGTTIRSSFEATVDPDPTRFVVIAERNFFAPRLNHLQHHRQCAAFPALLSVAKLLVQLGFLRTMQQVKHYLACIGTALLSPHDAIGPFLLLIYDDDSIPVPQPAHPHMDVDACEDAEEDSDDEDMDGNGEEDNEYASFHGSSAQQPAREEVVRAAPSSSGEDTPSSESRDYSNSGEESFPERHVSNNTSSPSTLEDTEDDQVLPHSSGEQWRQFHGFEQKPVTFSGLQNNVTQPPVVSMPEVVMAGVHRANSNLASRAEGPSPPTVQGAPVFSVMPGFEARVLEEGIATTSTTHLPLSNRSPRKRAALEEDASTARRKNRSGSAGGPQAFPNQHSEGFHGVPGAQRSVQPNPESWLTNATFHDPGSEMPNQKERPFARMEQVQELQWDQQVSHQQGLQQLPQMQSVHQFQHFTTVNINTPHGQIQVTGQLEEPRSATLECISPVEQTAHVMMEDGQRQHFMLNAAMSTGPKRSHHPIRRHKHQKATRELRPAPTEAPAPPSPPPPPTSHPLGFATKRSPETEMVWGSGPEDFYSQNPPSTQAPTQKAAPPPAPPIPQGPPGPASVPFWSEPGTMITPASTHHTHGNGPNIAPAPPSAEMSNHDWHLGMPPQMPPQMVPMQAPYPPQMPYAQPVSHVMPAQVPVTMSGTPMHQMPQDTTGEVIDLTDSPTQDDDPPEAYSHGFQLAYGSFRGPHALMARTG